MNAALQDIGLSTGKRNYTHSEGKQQQRKIAAFHAKRDGSLGNEANSQNGGNSQPNRRQHRTMQDVNGTLQLLLSGRVNTTQSIRRQDHRGDDGTAKSLRHSPTLDAVIQWNREFFRQHNNDNQI